MQKLYIFVSVLLIYPVLCLNSVEKDHDRNSVDSQFPTKNINRDDRIHRICIRDVYTDEEVENVRMYLAHRFSNTGPVKPLCKRLRVRRDIKCLSPKELDELEHAIKVLMGNGIWDYYSWIHTTYWPATHKFPESIPWHRWHIRQIEKQLQKVNPMITMPYWEAYSEFSAPERSSVWRFFGTSGDRSNNYTVVDGRFAYSKVGVPYPHYLQRQWNQDGTITPYEGPEWLTSVNQMTTDWQKIIARNGFTGHFKLHLSFGGWYSDYSVQWTTNDPLFYPFHVYPADIVFLKWQLSDDRFLVPQSYTGLNRYLTEQKRIVSSDIETDVFAFYTDTLVKEAFQVGFGDLCYIHDQFIGPINDIMRGIQREVPLAVKTLMQTLPKHSFRKYFPKFAANNATWFDHHLPDVGHCPDSCRPIPIAVNYNSTHNGLRQLDRFRYDAGIDITRRVFDSETLYYEFMGELRRHQYCSPYVT